MRHTNFYQKYKKLEEMEREELKKAVLAHGGEFRFQNEDGEDIEGVCPPIIVASSKYRDSSCDYYVTRVAVVKGCLEIYGYEKEWGTEEEYLDYIENGHINYIIDEIPETDKVKDVSTVDKLYETYYCSECGSSHTSSMAWVDNETGEINEYIGSRMDPDFNCCDDGCGNVKLMNLAELWEAFSEIPINNDDEIERDFLKFPAGTNRFDVWHWFDERCPNGVAIDLANK